MGPIAAGVVGTIIIPVGSKSHAPVPRCCRHAFRQDFRSGFKFGRRQADRCGMWEFADLGSVPKVGVVGAVSEARPGESGPIRGGGSPLLYRATGARLTLIAAALIVGAGGCRAVPGKRFGRRPDVVSIAGVGAPPKREVARAESPSAPDSSISSRVDSLGLDQRVGQVRGRVVDNRGVPVSEARVRLAVDGSPGGREVVGTTNRSGEFLLKGLRPGERYTLIAERDRGRDLLVGRASVAIPDESVEIRVMQRVSSETGDRPTSSTFLLDAAETPEATAEAMSGGPAHLRFGEGRTRVPDEERSAEAPPDAIDDRDRPRGAGWVPKDNVRRVALQSDDVADRDPIASENHFGLDPEPPAPAQIEVLDSPSGTGPGAIPVEVDRSVDPSPAIGPTDVFDDQLPQPLPNDWPHNSPTAAPSSVDDDRPSTTSPSRSSPSTPDRGDQSGPPVRHYAPKPDRKSDDDNEAPSRPTELPEEPSRHTSSTAGHADEDPTPSRSAGLMAFPAASPVLARSTPPSTIGAERRPEPPVATPEARVATQPPESRASIAEQATLDAIPIDPFAGLPDAGLSDSPATEPPPAFSQGEPIRWADLPEPERLVSARTDGEDAAGSNESAASKRRGPLDFLTKWVGGRSEAAASTRSPATACRFDPDRGRLETLEIVALNGDRITLDDQKGGHLLLVFWGAWSDYSIAAMPHLVELEEQFGDDRLRVVGIASPRDGEGERRAVLRTTRRLGVNFPVAFSPADEPDPVAEALDVRYYPTFILIDPAGNVIGRETGTTEESLARLDRTIASALDEPILTASRH